MPIPLNDLQSEFDAQWDTTNVVEPRHFIINDGTEPIRLDLNMGDYIVYKPGQPAEREQPIGTWVYGNRVWPIVLEIATMNSRQRLYDIKDEIRRICHARMHLMTNFQRVQYQSFTEYIEEEFNVWRGRIEVELVSSSILLEV